MAERRDRRVRLVRHVASPRFVAGQARAVLELMAGRPNLPVTAWSPEAVAGHRSRPTLLSNAETWAHVGRLLHAGPPSRARHRRRAGDDPAHPAAAGRARVAVREVEYGTPLRVRAPARATGRPARRLPRHLDDARRPPGRLAVSVAGHARGRLRAGRRAGPGRRRLPGRLDPADRRLPRRAERPPVRPVPATGCRPWRRALSATRRRRRNGPRVEQLLGAGRAARGLRPPRRDGAAGAVAARGVPRRGRPARRRPLLLDPSPASYAGCGAWPRGEGAHRPTEGGLAVSAGDDVPLAVRQALVQPLAVGGRDHPVALAVDEPDRHGDRGQVEVPRAQPREVVAHEAVEGRDGAVEVGLERRQQVGAVVEPVLPRRPGLLERRRGTRRRTSPASDRRTSPSTRSGSRWRRRPRRRRAARSPGGRTRPARRARPRHGSRARRGRRQLETRPGALAARARAYGPPPELPTATTASSPSWSASSSASAATGVRPGGLVVEAPYPGRDGAIRRTPFERAASATTAAWPAVPGVPWKKRTGVPAGSPRSAYSRVRPSRSVTVVNTARA